MSAHAGGLFGRILPGWRKNDNYMGVSIGHSAIPGSESVKLIMVVAGEKVLIDWGRHERSGEQTVLIAQPDLPCYERSAASSPPDDQASII